MGEVYRARDTKLGRDVAIKILPDLFAQDPGRLARFDREARTLASLNHPNIAHIHAVIDAPPALVMELVDGEDLAQRLARGRIPMEDALPVARQIADALEAAHEHGVIHRDLKPANVRLRPDGTVKVLDFGLAKAMDRAQDPASDPAVLLNSPTFTSPVMTEMGVILGTAAYMAPEQARGRTVDRRADIWAFGCVLYEMLAGRRPFCGEDTSMMLAAVLRQDVDFTALPADTPPAVHRLLRRCLEKDPRRRLSAIADARLELDDAATEPLEARAITPAPPQWWRPLAWAAAGAVISALAIAGVLMVREPPRPPASLVRSQLSFPGTPLTLANDRAFALNPSGTELVLAGQIDGDRYGLFRRRLDEDVVTPIAGTEGAFGPFFSPDGQWLAFVQAGRLKKMPVDGGAVVDLAEGPDMQGGSFAPDGSIVFNASHGTGLNRIEGPGTARVLTSVDRSQGEAGHHWPQVLPGGTHVLFTAEVDGKPYSDARVMVVRIDGSDPRLLIDGGTDGRYLPTGHIIYWRDKTLWTVPFDLGALQTSGHARAVVEGVMISEANGHAHFTVADNGTLAYLSGRDTQEERGILLVDRAGTARPLTAERKAYGTPSLSHDGRRLAMTIQTANDSLWTMDLDRPVPTRITYEAENANPVWSPDRSRLVLNRLTGGDVRQMHIMPSDGSATPELLRPSDRAEVPESWTATGNILAFTRMEPTGSDIWVMDMEARTARPFMATRFDESRPRFSPDGRWLAYASNESGRSEIYVRPFPGPGQKRLISTEGGNDARWRGDGRELFYRWGDAILSADITLAPQLSSSTPRVLFRGPYAAELGWSLWDALPDGRAFVLIRELAEPRTAVTLVQNWFEQLRSK